jgi:hypothetical protein
MNAKNALYNSKAKYKYSNPEEAANILIYYFYLKKNTL